MRAGCCPLGVLWKKKTSSPLKTRISPGGLAFRRKKNPTLGGETESFYGTSLTPNVLSYTQHLGLSLEIDKASSTRKEGRRHFIGDARACFEFQFHFLRHCTILSTKKIDRAADGNKNGDAPTAGYMGSYTKQQNGFGGASASFVTQLKICAPRQTGCSAPARYINKQQWHDDCLGLKKTTRQKSTTKKPAKTLTLPTSVVLLFIFASIPLYAICVVAAN